MEIIEGSTQIQQITIAEYGYQEHMFPHTRPVMSQELVARN